MAGSRPIVLLDVDGVLLDNHLYDSEWERLADAVLAPLLGARAEGWAELRRVSWLEVTRRIGSALWKQSPSERTPPASFWQELHEQWMARLCSSACVDAPATVEAREQLARRMLCAYLRETRAVVPGAGEAILQLSKRFELHMASGNPAFVVEAVLERIGVRELVGQPFGSDLAGAYKEDSPRFYEAILERIGARAQDVWVVDDRDPHLMSARALGLKTIKVGPARPPARPDFVVAAFAELPAVLDAN